MCFMIVVHQLVFIIISLPSLLIYILAMEYCGGPTLDQFRLKHKLNEEGVRNLFSQLGV